MSDWSSVTGADQQGRGCLYAGDVCAGVLPEAWGGEGAFPRLRVLAMRNSSLQGPLPAAWGNSSRALPALTILSLDSNKLSGSLPASWSQGLPSLT